ncbi:Uncharacterised protein [uncultured archaeon]|nr:Uncharacterised protein [uncultured archaeon]
MECAKNRIDIQTELTRVLDFSFEIAILDRTMEELDEIIARGKKEGQAAKLARTILMTKQVTILPTMGGHTDNLLVEMADENHIIATMDRALKQRLKRKKQDVVIIRGMKKLAVVGA